MVCYREGSIVKVLLTMGDYRHIRAQSTRFSKFINNLYYANSGEKTKALGQKWLKGIN